MYNAETNEWDHDLDTSFCSPLHLTLPLAPITDPYDGDQYCCWCGNGAWKHHAPWCKWADAYKDNGSN